MVSTAEWEGYKKAVAEIFDARTDYNLSESHARLADRLLRLAAPQAGEGVLDIATGTGFIAIPAASLVGEYGTVTGVDISAGMLSQAKEAASIASLTNLTLLQADAESLNYPSDSFDLVVCCNALPYMSDVSTALRHWYSLLRPGGRLAFNVWAEDSYATGYLLREIAARYGIRVAVIGQQTGTPERCRTVLADAGFSRPKVVLESTATFFSVSQLEIAPKLLAKNPLYNVRPDDLERVNGLMNEYIAEARSASVRNAIDTEMGAFFVLAHKPAASAPLC